MARPEFDRDVDFSDREAKRQVMAFVGTLVDLYEVKLHPCRPVRTIQQNKFYWKVVVKPFMDFLTSQGQAYTKYQCHEVIALRCAPVDVVNPATGEVIGIVGKSTSKMSVEEFSEYTERAMAYLAEQFGIEFAGPGINDPAAAGKGSA